MLGDLKDHVKGEVRFEHYRAGHLHYVTDSGLQFTVPIEDVGDATFPARDRAMLYMRYIRKQLAALEASGKKENQEDNE